MRKVPKLRFKEFNDEWEEKKLEKIANFSKGKLISKEDISKSGIECIRYGELYTTYNEVIDKIISRTNINSSQLVFSEKNDIIIPSSGETNIDIAKASCVMKDKVALGGDLNILKTKEDGIFLSYYMNNKLKYKIASLAQGASVIHLYETHLKLLKLNLPRLEEQEKIANFLSSVNKKISLTEEKLNLFKEYKKGIMQKIFSQELRFKDSNGNNYPNWEEQKLGDMLEVIVDNRGKTPPNTNDKILIPLIEVNAVGSKNIKYKNINKFVDNNTYTNWFRNHIIKNDILFSTVGATALCSIYNEDIKSVIAQNLVGLRVKKWIISDYLYYLLTERKNNLKFKTIEMIAVQPSIKVSQMINLKFKISKSFEEQKKIADFLSSIDNKIEKIENEVENLKEFKKGLLQQMFI